MASEVSDLKKQVQELEQRVSQLESTTQDTPAQPKKQSQPKPNQPQRDSNILGWVGGVVLSLGFIFLVAYAIDNGWISRALQIILGIVLGAGLVAGGSLLHKRMQLQGSLLCATGAIIAYFSVYSSYAFDTYRQATGMGFVLASTLLLAVLLATIYLSYRQQSQTLIMEVLLLSFISLTLGSFEWLSIVYTSLIVLGFSWLCYKHKWYRIALAGGILTTLTILVSMLAASDAQFYVLLAISSLSFAALGYSAKSAESVTAVIAVSYLLLLIPLDSKYHAVLSLVAAALCQVLYAIETEKQPSYLAGSIAFIMLFIAIQFSGYVFINGWLLIAAIVAAAHAQTTKHWLLPISIITSAVAVAGVIAHLSVSYEQLPAIGTLVFVSIASISISYQYALKNRFEAHPYYIAGVLALLVLVLLELTKFWITVSWAVLAFISLFVGLQTNRTVPKNVGLAVLAIAVAKLFVVDTISLDAGLRIIAYITLGVLLLLGSIGYKKYFNE